MTSQMQMPSDLEALVAESVKAGVEDEEALEDAVMKIQEYRTLFGLGLCPETQTPRDIQGLKTLCEPFF